MSVDFKACSKCGESLYDEFVGTCGGECGTKGCYQSLCTHCLVNDEKIDSSYAYEYGTRFDGTPEQIKELGLEGYSYKIGDLIDDTGIDPKYCPYCSGEEVHGDEILGFLLNLHKDLTKEDIKSMILEERKKG
jgi:hypothetical protein